MSLKTMLITGTLVASLGTTTAAYATSHHTLNLSSNTKSTASHQQADTNHFGMVGHFHHMRAQGFLNDTASILKVDKKTLISDLKSGKSLADIASSKGISKQDLISKLNADMKTRLDTAVKNGKLTAAKEQMILKKSQVRLTKLVDQKGFGKMGPRSGHMRGGMGLFKNAASILNVDQKTLMNDLKSGKSLADIASSKGISKQDLVSKLNADLKTRLDTAVKNGKLTAAKEQMILKNSQVRLTKIVDQKGFGKMGPRSGHMRGGMGLFKSAASILNEDQKTLMNDLKSGKSLADIASSKGISKQDLVSKLNADLKTRLDAAVKSGKLTAAKEQSILKNSQARLTKLVDKKGFEKMGPRGDHMRGGMGLFKGVASILNVDQKTLMNDLKSGKSLADIATSKGISKQDLISKLNADLKTRLDKAVANGKLTAAKEQTILKDSQARLTKLVDQKGFGHDGKMDGGDQGTTQSNNQGTAQSNTQASFQ